MDSKQLTQGLHQAFFTENHRIVFWYDADQSFAEDLPQLNLPNVHALNRHDESTFRLKLNATKLDQGTKASTTEIKALKKQLATLHNQQAEPTTFDEKLRHHSDLRINLVLDDGVKVNYGKFGDLLAEVKAITGDKPADA